MVISGYAARGFLYQALGYAVPHLLDFGGSFASAAVIAITLVQLVIGLGGAVGFLGLLISLGCSVYKGGGIDPILYYLPYWVGLAISVVGRRLAKGA